MHVLFADDLVDLGTAAEYVVGVDEVEQAAKDFPPEVVAAACGIDAPTIRRIALELAEAPTAAVAEMASMMPALDNISWDRVEREDHVTYPTDGPDIPGRDVVFDKGYPAAGRLRQAGRHQIHARRTRCPTPSIRSSSPPAASSSIGTPAR